MNGPRTMAISPAHHESARLVVIGALQGMLALHPVTKAAWRASTCAWATVPAVLDIREAVDYVEHRWLHSAANY